jgi:hypothetical protein
MVHMYVPVHACVCVCVWERERERERDMFLYLVFYGSVGIIWVCNVGVNGCMCVVLGKKGIFQIVGPLAKCLILCKYVLLISGEHEARVLTYTNSSLSGFIIFQQVLKLMQGQAVP